VLRCGPEAVLYAILDEVVDECAPVVAGLENDIDEIEDQLFKGDPSVSRPIYEMLWEVIEFQRATHPRLDVFTSLENGFDRYNVDVELRRNLRDVQDRAIRVVERADSFLTSLQNALTVHTALVAESHQALPAPIHIVLIRQSVGFGGDRNARDHGRRVQRSPDCHRAP
jgi:magnesium transporter